MNIGSSTSTPVSMTQSILKSANEQPKLALQLLQQSLAGMTQSSQSLPSPAPAASPAPSASPHIDIRV